MSYPTIVHSGGNTSGNGSQSVTCSLGGAATAGNLLVFVVGVDKDHSNLAVAGLAGEILEVNQPSASVSQMVVYGVASGGETQFTGTIGSPSQSGMTAYALELAQDGGGDWVLAAKATTPTTEASITNPSTGTTGAALQDALAIAWACIDSSSNVTGVTGWSNGYTARYTTAPTPPGTDGGAAGLYVATNTVAKGATTGTTLTRTGSADQMSAGVLAFGRDAPSSVTKSGADTGTGASTGTVSARPTGSDTAAGTEGGYVAVPRSGADTGTGSESGHADIGQVGGDTGTGGPATGSVDATVTSADTGAGAAAGQISADTTATPDTADGATTGTITIPGADTATGDGEVDSLLGDTTGDDQAGGAEGGYVETRYGNLVISIWAVDPDTGDLTALPDFTELTLSPQRNSPGAISMAYPEVGLNFSVLRDMVRADRDLEVEIWTLGSPQGARRGYLQEATGDDVAEYQTWTFTGGFAELRMTEAVVYPQDQGAIVDDGDPSTIDEHANEQRELVFSAATPGEVALFILAQAQARGALTDIGTDFTTTHDSDGNPWPLEVSTKFSPGAGYDQILGKLVDLGLAEWAVEWTGTARVLRLWVPEGRGTDRTTELRPVVLRRGRNLVEAPNKWSVRDAGTAVLAAGADGIYQNVSSVDAQTRRGRRIERAAAGGNNLTVPDAVQAYAQAELSGVTQGRLEVTHGLAFLPGEPRPIIAFDVDDWIYSQTGLSLDRLRVVQWSLTVSPTSQPSGTVTLNDSLEEWRVRLDRRLDALTAGDTVVGTSSVDEDTGVPVAPVGVLVGSLAFVDGLDVYSSVQVGWSPVEQNTDGSACTDLDGYRCEYALASSPGEWQFGFDVGQGRNSASFTTLPGRIVYVRVLAYDRNGNRSAWSAVAEHVTEDDTTPPPVTSAPSCSNFLGTLKITWDGRSESGTEMVLAAPDFSHVEVHLSPGSGFTPDASTLVGRMFGRGDFVVTDLPYEVAQFARLVAVDVRGNVAEPSGQGSATPGKVVADDIFAGAVGSAALADLAVKRANIDDLAVNNAKIGDVSMGKVTAGQIRAAMIFTSGGLIGTRGVGGTGPGWDGDSAGIRFYNSAGTNTINFNAVTGGALVTGEYRTAMTGSRMILNPGGAAADEIRFYPMSTNQYGTLTTVTSTSPNYPNQAGIIASAHSSRSDDFTGRLRLFPDYASFEWGYSFVQPSPNLMGLRAPRIHIGMPRGSGFGGGDDETLRVGVQNISTSDYIDKTVISYDLNSFDIPSWRNINQGSGLEFGPGYVGSIQGDSSGYNPIRASAFQTYTSLRATKQDFTDLDDPLGALRHAPVQKWRRISEVEAVGGAAEVHIGAMADDLPPEIVRSDIGPGGVTGYSVESLLGLVHAGVNQLAARVDGLVARVDRLDEA